MTDLQNPLVAAAKATPGNETRLRSDETRGLVVSQNQGTYYESSNQGSSWTISTNVAGIATTALFTVSTASAIPIVGVFNPTGSGVNLSIQRTIVLQTTGTAVSSFVWGAIAGATGMSGSSGVQTGINNKTFTAGGHGARAFAGATALVGTPLMYRVIGGPTAGAFTASQNATVRDDVDGEIIVRPGNFVGVFGTTTTIENVVRASLTWTEVPTTA